MSEHSAKQKKDAPTDSEVVDRIIEECAWNGITMDRAAVWDLLDIIRKNKAALEFLGRL